MPNWITNMVYISSKDSKYLIKIKECLKSNYGAFDFNCVIKPTKSANEAWGANRNAKEVTTQFDCSFIESLLIGLPSIKASANQKSIIELMGANIESFTLAKELIKNNKLPSILSFLEEEFIFYSFETAWTMPHYVFVEISRRFPNCNLNVIWADEDIGSNCGIEIYKNGQSNILFESNCDKKDYQKEQYRKFACTVVGYDWDEYNKEY